MQEYKTKKVFAGGVAIGGGAPVTVQSMLNIPAHDIAGNVEQAKALEKAGCDIIRISVPDKESVKTLAALKSNISIPVVADIHFDYRLAIAAIEDFHMDKLRLYPNASSEVLRRAAAYVHGLSPEQVFCGNGSDEVLAIAFQAFFDDTLSFCDISYSFYPVWAEMYGISYETVPLREDFFWEPCLLRKKGLPLSPEEAMLKRQILSLFP